MENTVVQKTATSKSTEIGGHDFQKKKVIFRYYQVVWYILGVIETLLLIRFFFKLIAANPASPIVSFIYALSAPFALPFLGVTQTTGINNNVFELSTLIACVFYLIIAYGIVKLAQFIKPADPVEVETEISQ